MILNLVVAVTLSLATSLAYGQSMYTVGSPVERGSPLSVLKSQSGPPQGSVYLNTEWTVATFELVRGTSLDNQLKDIPMRLDLKTNTFELNSPLGIKVLEGNRVERFYYVSPKTGIAEFFFNCSKFTLGGTPVIGFCKMVGTKVSLASYSTVKFFRADYNVTLNTGRKEDEYVKTTTLYLVKDKVFFPANKKNLFGLMVDSEAELKKFIKDQRININKEEGLRLVVEYYDLITKPVYENEAPKSQ